MTDIDSGAVANESKTSEWDFEKDTVIREQHNPQETRQGGFRRAKKEYYILRRFIDVDADERSYRVLKETDDITTYNAETLEGRYETIELAESKAFEYDGVHGDEI